MPPPSTSLAAGAGRTVVGFVVAVTDLAGTTLSEQIDGASWRALSARDFTRARETDMNRMTIRRGLVALAGVTVAGTALIPRSR